MGDKTLIPVVTSLALMQLQSMPYCSYWSVRRLVPRLRKTSQQLIREGVQTVGVETMEGIMREFSSKTKRTRVTAVTELINFYHSYVDGRMICVFAYITG
jgi:hypothetical protein